ncbi:NUDIX hydrolase [Acinetobacter sp. HY1485]|uniref:NUDIX hydrolase n=1 Tax=Acinetobacter sp. HY1485 TaxID=2970918 RepID=UPI0022B9A8E0|nr:hypothetical protein [Acinetobacter sp. HY1485]
MQNLGSNTEVVAVLIAITNFSARILTIDQGRLLPSGPITPVHHSLQAGARAWVKQQTQQPLGYIEQLYTFVDMERSAQAPFIYISYLGLVKEAEETILELDAKWHDWYDYFPWENFKYADHTPLLKQLTYWADSAPNTVLRQHRLERISLCWGLNDYLWLEENTLLRYELLYEAGLVQESPYFAYQLDTKFIGQPMQYNHRRILATAISRLRSKIKYRPVIFELLPDEFTLLQLQKSIETLTGIELHKQNFRRLMQNQNLLEATGKEAIVARGRPAQLYRFNQKILQEYLLSHSKLPKIAP